MFKSEEAPSGNEPIQGQQEQDQHSITVEKITLYWSFFRGENSSYAKRVEGHKASYISVKAPVTKSVVRKHLTGEQPILIYTIIDSDKVYYAALDFDNKPGKPDEAYYFSDVLAASDIMDQLGIPHVIARSSGLGFHIYVFFSEPCPAFKIRSVFLEIFQRTGFRESHRLGTRPLPERFPKQDRIQIGKSGNGIRPPLSATGLALGRNCFVNRNNEFIVDQWAYLASIKKISVSYLDQIIAHECIELFDSKPPRRFSELPPPSAGKEHPKLRHQSGLSNVFLKCPAMAALAQHAKTKVLGYHAGFSLYSLVKEFHGGRAWFRKNVLGWDDTPEHQHELDKFDCCFHTCSFLQTHNICPFKSEETCLLREYRKGVLTSPSPIRFANSKVVSRRKLLGGDDHE